MATFTVPAVVPSPQEDAEQLHKAFGGWGTNEDLIISILTHRNAHQRTLIRKAYADAYNEDLLKALDKELSSDFERAILLWTLEPAERDALIIHESTKRFTSNLWIVAEIVCTRSTHEMFLVRQAYHARHKRSLEEDVAQHATGDFRKLLHPLAASLRYEGDEVNVTLAKRESKILRDKITDKAYNDDEVIRIISTRSKAQLNATLNHYNNSHGNAINKDLGADKDDEFLKLLRYVIKCLTVPEKHFEKVLRLSINKMGTDEWGLTRVITTRAEIDLVRIKEEYHRRNSVPLDKAIAKDVSGDYEKFLIELTAPTCA